MRSQGAYVPPSPISHGKVAVRSRVILEVENRRAPVIVGDGCLYLSPSESDSQF